MNYAAIKLSSVQHEHISLGLSKFKQQQLLITPVTLVIPITFASLEGHTGAG